MTTETLERIVKFSPAFDKREETPNYGHHPMHIHFAVRGERGVLVFDICTGWYIDSRHDYPPECYAFCWHVYPTNPHVDLDQVQPCKWLDGEECVCITHMAHVSNHAKELLQGFLANGDNWLFEQLEYNYRIAVNKIEEPEGI